MEEGINGVCVHLDREGEGEKMSHTQRQHGISRAPVQQEASGEGRAALSMERTWQSCRGDLGELPRQASSGGETAGSQECLSTEITDLEHALVKEGSDI